VTPRHSRAGSSSETSGSTFPEIAAPYAAPTVSESASMTTSLDSLRLRRRQAGDQQQTQLLGL
jgi:hypothetical protein